MRKSAAFASFAILHAGLSVGAIALALGAGMARFDAGGAPSLSDQMLFLTSRVLLFPIGTLSELAPIGWVSGLWGYAVICLNSSLWAGAFIHAYHRYRQARDR
jgi:hypothetical protein